MKQRSTGTAGSLQPRINEVRTVAQIARCHSVMRELRPQVASEDEFVKRVRRQAADGYRLVCLEAAGEIRAVAGYRLSESLFSGRHLYVDDLITRERDRSSGFGRLLFDWLVARARRANCVHLELDSGVQRFHAHQFYFARRMHISSYHFSLPLNGKPAAGQAAAKNKKYGKRKPLD